MSREKLAAKFAELKRLLLEAKDLAQISDYFGDYLVEDSEFMRRGVSARHALLEQVIRGALRACFGSNPLYDLHLLHVAEWNFWHGAAVWRPNGVVLVLYFEGPDLGLLSVARSLQDSTVHFVRFSVCAARAPGGSEIGDPNGLN
jgi:hypothetical protein